MNSTELGKLIYAKVFKPNVPVYPCNLVVDKITIVSIEAHPKHGIIFHTSKKHGMPLAHLDKNDKYLKIISDFITAL